MRRTLALMAGLLLVVSVAAPVAADRAEIEFIGEETFPTGFLVDGVEMGGLSGITRDAGAGIYYAISDDRSQIAPARFYTLTIDLTDGSLDSGDVSFLDQTTLLAGDGLPYDALELDPEGIALSTSETLFISSEGDTALLQAPFVNEYTLDGQLIDEFPIPRRYLPTTDGSSGIRQNAAFESLTVSPNGRRLTTATENALFQDGPAATLDTGSSSRILVYNSATERVLGEFVYENEPVTDEPIPAGSFSVNGLVELLELDAPGTYLALERSFSVGVGNNVRLYLISARGADNVRGDFAIDDPVPVSKQLLLDLTTLGITLDNLEGLALGPPLADGRTPLIVVSDNNFGATQFTQFLAFALDL